MALPPDVEQRLNDGAVHARADFEENWQKWTTVKEVAEWYFKWCRGTVMSEGNIYNGTNYDRLGKILMEVTGVRPKPSQGVPADELGIDIDI